MRCQLDDHLVCGVVVLFGTQRASAMSGPMSAFGGYADVLVWDQLAGASEIR
jgi:hypothetical protein